MHRRRVSSLLGSSLLVLGLSSHASAAIIFEASPSFAQPGEHLLFDDLGLFAGPGSTVQDATSQTRPVFDPTGLVSLTSPASGPSRVEDEAEGGFSSLAIQALDNDVFFKAFSFQLAIAGDGQDAVGLSAIDGQSADAVLITTNATLQDVRRLRLGGVGIMDDVDGPAGVPEPTSLVLLGAALLGIGILSRRR